MPAKAHSRAVKLSATFLAKLAGVDTAASLFGIDRRTVRGWLGSVEVPEDHWSAIEATLLARGAEMTAKGETRGLVPTLTGAGIASRNRRYQQLITQRDARRQAATEADQPAPNPIKEQLDRLDDKRQQLTVRQLDLAIARNKAEGTEPAEPMDEEKFLAVVTELVERLLAEPDEQIDQWLAEVIKEQSEHQKRWVQEVQERASAQAEQARAARDAAERSQPAADSPRTPEEPARPSLRVVDDPPGAWQPYGRWDIR